jgi:hypothetical protein
MRGIDHSVPLDGVVDRWPSSPWQMVGQAASPAGTSATWRRLSVCRAGTRAGAWRARQDKGRGRVSIRVTVGMPVARHPPHRSVRALLTHTVLTSDLFPREANVRSAYALQPAWPDIPAQGAARVRLYRVLLGQWPSLHDLLRPSLACVRPLRWYYTAVRLPMAVHVGLNSSSPSPTVPPPCSRGWQPGLSVLACRESPQFPCMPGVYDSAVPATHKRYNARRSIAFRFA